MTTPKSITCVSDLINIVNSRKGERNLWWRGQDGNWPLIAGIFRYDDFLKRESLLISLFIQRAPSRYSACPQKSDHLPEWIFLMQHYGLATRFLDWSESPMLALFFAVERNDSTPGELFVIDPFKLNKSEFNEAAIFHAKNEAIYPFYKSAYWGTGNPTELAGAILVDQSDPRMLAQQTAMTIHSRKEALSNNEYLTRYDIAAEHKKKIRDELWNLGIRRSNLFPDLANLAIELNGVEIG